MTTNGISRREFMKAGGLALGASTVTALGFSMAEAQASVRPFKLERTTETRNTCPYCSVGCGVILYSLGDRAKNVHSSIIHVEGDPDHPTNRGTLCPKGAGLLDFIHAETRLRFPEYRAPRSNEWRHVSWDWAIDRIAHLAKDDRDRNFIARNGEGQVVNRWVSTGFLAASATSNETAFLTYKVVRALGMVAFDNQARV